jgi:hypothetical protein
VRCDDSTGGHPDIILTRLTIGLREAGSGRARVAEAKLLGSGGQHQIVLSSRPLVLTMECLPNGESR